MKIGSLVSRREQTITSINHFNLEELLLRVRAVLRRTQEHKTANDGSSESTSLEYQKYRQLANYDATTSCLQLKGYSLDLKTYEVTLPDKTQSFAYSNSIQSSGTFDEPSR